MDKVKEKLIELFTKTLEKITKLSDIDLDIKCVHRLSFMDASLNCLDGDEKIKIYSGWPSGAEISFISVRTQLTEEEFNTLFDMVIAKRKELSLTLLDKELESLNKE